jgi:hypothetical protein
MIAIVNMPSVQTARSPGRLRRSATLFEIDKGVHGRIAEPGEEPPNLLGNLVFGISRTEGA